LDSNCSDKVVSVIEPQSLRIEDLKGGVGSPCTVYNPFKKQTYLLFTGWKDPNGSMREGWVAPIEKDLSIDWKEAVKILPFNIPRSDVKYTNNAVRGVFNPAKREYIVTVTTGNYGYLCYFDEDWKLKALRQVSTDLWDHGLPIAPFGAYGRLDQALTTVPKDNRVKIGVLNNIDDPERASLTLDDGYAFWQGLGNALCDMTVIPRLTLLYEADEFNQWHLKIGLGPSPIEMPRSEENLIHPEFQVGFLVAPLQDTLPFGSQYIQTGHPHYTTYPDGKPKLFVASFRDTWSQKLETGKEGYTHEIHAAYLDGVNIFNHETYGVLKDAVIMGAERPPPSKWYDIKDAKEILLMIRGLPSGGTTLILDEASSMLEALKGDYVSTTYTILSDQKLIVKDPSPSVRIRMQTVRPKVTLIAKY